MFSTKENVKLSPVFILRIGLGLTLLYASLHMFLESQPGSPLSPVGLAPL